MGLSEISSSTNADKLFVSSTQKQAELEYLASNVLQNGMKLYQKEDYEGAARAFKGALSMAPSASFSKDSAKYLAMAQMKLGHTEKAIDAYQTSIKYNPDLADPHVDLAKLYFGEKRYKEASLEYEKAVNLDPSSNNRYSLGQAYLFQDRYAEAETEFQEVRRLEPDSPYSFFGLGLAYSKQGRYEQAVEVFKEAVNRDREFYDAYAEMGYAYADSGEMEAAEQVFEILEEESPDLADTLSRYMYKVDPPKISFASSMSTFNYMAPRMTKVSNLDAYLENADAKKTFTMIFQFDKKMDRLSVENRFNWKISRAEGSNPGEAYNFDLPMPSTEVSIPSFADNVFWDEGTMTAKLQFTIQQNASADGTIDPSHMEFKFAGVDEYGLTMDPEGDQYTGFSKVY
ncbi:MAG: tetratricopeptide repeat protein [Deltaproteobacteria bacterium]|nr:tetratricopeptide repeat protein [Deltaproteobacteria bacterium]